MLSVEKSWSPLHVYHYQTYAVGLIVDENCRISSFKVLWNHNGDPKLKMEHFCVKTAAFYTS